MQHPMSAARSLTTYYAATGAEADQSTGRQPSVVRPLPAQFTETVRAEIRMRPAASAGTPGPQPAAP